MNDAPIDPELLAAVLDGTASERERTEVLVRLARSKDDYARFLDAAAIQAELQRPALSLETPASGQATVTPIAARKRPTRFVAPLLLLAAALTIVVLTRSRTAAMDVMKFAEAGQLISERGNGKVSQALGPAWDDRGWSVTRGSESVQGTPSRSFRAGVRVAQLAMAARAGDSAAVAQQAINLGDLLANVEGASPLVMRLSGLAQQVQLDQSRTRLELASQLRALLGGEDWFDLGIWTESAHVAARNGQVEFFAVGGAPLTALTQLLARPAIPPEVWARETRALRALSTGGARDRSELPAIDGLLTVVLAAAGG